MGDQPRKTSTNKASTDQLRGSLKEAIGKLTGDVRTEAEGKAQKQTPTSDVKPGSAKS